MTKQPDHHQDRRSRLATAAAGGAVAGAVRAGLDWLLRWLAQLD